MPEVKKRKSDDVTTTYVVEGAAFRCQIKVHDYRQAEHEALKENTLRVMVYRLDQSYHPCTPYHKAGHLVYKGSSVEKGWKKVKRFAGAPEMPDDLQSIPDHKLTE